MKSCLVTTLRDADAVAETFVAYHHSLGFTHIYLFFDESDSLMADALADLPYVTCFKRGELLEKQWKQNKLYEDYRLHINREVMARQILNVEVAIRLAQQANYDWILHIDIDELFVCEEDLTSHFQRLTNEGNSVVHYLNHEAVPEQTNIMNYFEEVTLFKLNPHLLTRNQISICEATIGQFKNFFRFYRNGKSAGYLHQQLLPHGVHEFLPDKLTKTEYKGHILHYPCCGFSQFWKKYKMLGDFSNYWFDQYPISHSFPTHTTARDVVKTNDQELALRFYKLMFTDQAKTSIIDKLIDNSIYFRFHPLKQRVGKL
ncbi:glycosyltransferase family 2 protein [Spirosoma sp.]|uniref:glycosyltransferase family 2 protein n=1 Tax=Spirosoma sp. TaxID=1899569 RepID=UPI0026145E57|nr:glycosyltransferase family 2 protein [Spirosoma sp.]MCX6212992.1 glycosyltransferase family 2 protein [Spirosoma sp.]